LASQCAVPANYYTQTATARVADAALFHKLSLKNFHISFCKM